MCVLDAPFLVFVAIEHKSAFSGKRLDGGGESTVGDDHREAPSYAPGWPGIEPRWTSSAKPTVGASSPKKNGIVPSETSRSNRECRSMNWPIRACRAGTGIEKLPIGRQVTFRFYWNNTARWEGRDYQLAVE